MKLKYTALALVGAGFVLMDVHGAILVNTNFDTGYTAESSLNGQSGSGDVGLAGTWSVQESYTTYATIKAATSFYDLTYDVAGGGTVASGANVMQMAYPGTSGVLNGVASRALSSNISGQNVFMGMTFRRTGNNTLSSSLNMSLFASDSAASNIYASGLGIYKGHVEAGPQATSGGQFTSSGPAFSSITSNVTYFLVAEYVWSLDDSAYTSVNFWLNPNVDGSSSLAAASYDLVNNVAAISHVGVSVANLTSGNAFSFDSVRLATEWSDIVPVPEPGYVLPMIAFLGFLLWRKSRRCLA